MKNVIRVIKPGDCNNYPMDLSPMWLDQCIRLKKIIKAEGRDIIKVIGLDLSMWHVKDDRNHAAIWQSANLISALVSDEDPVLINNQNEWWAELFKTEIIKSLGWESNNLTIIISWLASKTVVDVLDKEIAPGLTYTLENYISGEEISIQYYQNSVGHLSWFDIIGNWKWFTQIHTSFDLSHRRYYLLHPNEKDTEDKVQLFEIKQN